MKRTELIKIVIKKIIEIQEKSGREVPKDIDEKTVPIGTLTGFDSLNGIELGVMISEAIEWPAEKNLCVSDDGTKPLNIGQIANRLLGV